MKRRHLLWLALLATLALVATACGGGEEEGGQPAAGKTLSGTTITFSTVLAEAELPAVREVLGKFEAQTGAKVNFTQVTSADLPQKLQVEVGSGQHTIDLFAQDNLALKVLVDRKLVEDLSAVQIPAGVKQELLPEKFDASSTSFPTGPTSGWPTPTTASSSRPASSRPPRWRSSSRWRRSSSRRPAGRPR